MNLLLAIFVIAFTAGILTYADYILKTKNDYKRSESSNNTNRAGMVIRRIK